MMTITASRAAVFFTLAFSVTCAWSSPESAARDAEGGAPPAVRFSAAQLSEVQTRWTLARQIVGRLEPEARELGLGPAWQQATMNLLLGNSSTKLSAIAKIGGYQAVIKAATQREATTQKALGDANSDLVFKPFTPCRYLDTRNVGGKISGTRSFDLANNGGTYGGVASCDPKTLAGVANEDLIGALAANITIVDTSAGAPGFVAVRPAGSTALSSLLNWYVASASAQDANAAIVAIDQTAATDEFEILTSGPVHVIVDLLGVFISPIATALDCITVQSTNGNKSQAPGANDQFGTTCTTGYQVTGGGCHFSNTDGTPATENTVVINKCSRSFDVNTQQYLNAWFGQWTNNDLLKSFRFNVRAMCCRTPGR